MKKSTIIKTASSALVAGVACAALGTGLSLRTTSAMVSYEELFSGQNVTKEYTDAPAALADFDDRSGVQFTATQEGASVRFVDTASGVFEMEYRVFSEQAYVCSLESLRLVFTDAYTADSFALEIGLTSDGIAAANTTGNTQVRAVVDTGYGKGYAVDGGTNELTTYGRTLDSSYCNTKSDSVVVQFDPSTMCVYASEGAGEETWLLLNMKDEAHLLATGRENPMSDFAEYCVDIQFARFGENAKSAGLMLYSLFGNTVDSAWLSETAGPSVYVNTDAKAKANEAYDVLDGVKVYDLLEGQLAFDGEVKVYDPLGNSVAVTNGKFTPQTAGEYTLEYTAKNAAQTAGATQRAVLEVVDYSESFHFELSRAFIAQAIGTGTSVTLPSMRVWSNYSARRETPCTVKITKDGATLFNAQAAENEAAYTFASAGTYAVTYSANVQGAGAFEKSYTVTVSDELPAFTGESVLSSYGYGEILNVPAKTATLNGAQYATTAQVLFSDGRTNGASTVLLDTDGACEVRYTAQIAGTSYTYSEYFNVYKNAETLWENLGGAEIYGNVDLPEYADVYGNGVKLTATRTGASVGYTNVLDLSNSTLQTPVLEAMFTPEEYGSKEFTYLEIRLIDVHDSDNYIVVKIGEVGYGYGQRSSVSCGANLGYEPVGMNTGGSMGTALNATRIASTMQGKHNGKNGFYRSLPFAIYFDAESKAIYAGPNGNLQSLSLVARLADTTHVGEGNEWGGFTTGEVRLELRFLTLVSTSANLNVLSVYGQSMRGQSIEDTTPPSVFLSDYEAGNEPKALVGQKYEIFEGNVFDAVDGDLGAASDVSVYYMNGANKEYLSIEQGGFIPTVAGTYYVEYFGVDKANNATVKTVQIEALDALPELTYTLNSALPTSVYVGESVRIPSGKASGGAGNLNVVSRIKAGDETYEDLDKYFQIKYEGTYTYEVTVTDYIGQTKTFTYPITATLSATPLVEEKQLPKAIVINKPYVFPEFTAIRYGNGTETALGVEISVNGTKLSSSRIYTPSSTAALNVTYSTEGWSKAYTVAVVNPLAADSYLNEYFFYSKEEITLNAEEDYLGFATDEVKTADGKTEFSFINPLGLTNARIEFSVLKNNFEKVNVYLTDKDDSSVQLKLTVEKDAVASATSTFRLNDGVRRVMAGSFYEGQTRIPFTFVLTGNTISDYEGTVLGTATETLAGEPFEGFPSGMVYVSFEMEGVTGASEIGLIQLWNQPFGFTYGDYIQPLISVGELDGKYAKGDVITLPEFLAFDVLDSEITLELTVRVGTKNLTELNSGKPLKTLLMEKGETYQFQIEEFGRYDIIIEVTDLGGEEYSYRKTFYVDGTTLPTLTVNGGFETSYKAGEAIVPPTATASDYQGEALDVYVYFVDKSGRYHDLTAGTYKPTDTGYYTVVYYCYDEFGNYAMQKYTVYVK